VAYGPGRARYDLPLLGPRDLLEATVPLASFWSGDIIVAAVVIAVGVIVVLKVAGFLVRLLAILLVAVGIYVLVS
jgi:hypothetical protein